MLRGSSVASTQRNLGRQLVDGHWVLSFPDAEAAQAARDLLDQHQVMRMLMLCAACQEAVFSYQFSYLRTDMPCVSRRQSFGPATVMLWHRFCCRKRRVSV